MSVTILAGHVLDRLAELPDESVQLVCTSPPYYALRSYGTEPQVWGGDPLCIHEWLTEVVSTELGKGNWSQGTNGRGELQPGGVAAKREPIRSQQERGFCQRCNAWRGELGQEPTLDLYLDHLMLVFVEVRRVLRSDGCCFVNIGDSFVAGTSATRKPPKNVDVGGWLASGTVGDRRCNEPSLAAKQLMLVPFRFALRMQESGWWVRNDLIWAKTACMPESVTDRATRSHEFIFHFTKSARYFYDAEAVAEQSDQPFGDVKQTGQHKSLITMQGGKASSRLGSNQGAPTRNQRTVWTIGPEPLKDSHYASFPSEIPRRCIKAGTSDKGCCPTCGKPWERVTEREEIVYPNGIGNGTVNQQVTAVGSVGSTSCFKTGKGTTTSTTGWRPTCDHALDPVPCVVLDPFGGSGRTGLVADELNRNAILIELKPDYVRMSERVIRGASPMFAQVEVA